MADEQGNTTVADPIGSFQTSQGITPPTEKTQGAPNAAGTVDPETGTTGSDNAGEPKGSSEDGQSSPAPRRRGSASVDWKSLRAERRELRTQLASMQEELRALREARSAPEGAGRTEQPDFWSDPAASIHSQLQALREEMRQELHGVRELDQAQAKLNAEKADAVEFIRSQKGWSSDDEADLIEIIHDYGFTTMAPMKAAKAALAILNQERGVGDKTALKHQASSMAGAPPAAGMKKQYSEAEIGGILDKCERDPNLLTPELEKEIRDAYREGRVK